MTVQTTSTFAKRISPAALVLAGVVAGALFSDSLRPSVAMAQDGETMTNALEQRKQMIAQLSSMNERLGRIENALSAGVKVKVTEMPPVTVKESAGK